MLISNLEFNLLLLNPINSLLPTSANAIIAIEKPAKVSETPKLVNAGMCKRFRANKPWHILVAMANFQKVADLNISFTDLSLSTLLFEFKLFSISI